MPVRVQGTGPHHAPLCILGEAPGRDEVAYGTPFVGEAGHLLDELLAEQRIVRADVRIENVCEERPPANKLERLGLEAVRRWIVDARRRVVDERPNVVAACGNLAWNALRYGPESVRVNKKGALVYRDKITTWRGSIVVVEIDGVSIKVIPILHPAFLLRAPAMRKRTTADWRRVKGEMSWPEYRAPQVEHIVDPTVKDVEDFAAELTDDPPPFITHDIETPGTIGCIGYASSAERSFTIPTTVAYWRGAKTMARVWRAIHRIERLPIATITQNGFYDHYRLRRQANIVTTKWTWDLLAMHHTLDPLEAHKLDVMASILLHDYTFWKEEAKDPDSVKKYASDFHALCVYNGMDCTYQYACFEVLLKMLQTRGMLSVYREHYQVLLNPLLGVMLHGWRIDQRTMRRQYKRVVMNCFHLENEIEAMVGKPLHAKTGLSNKKIVDYCYGELALRVPRGSRRAADAVSLARLAAKYPRQVGALVPLLIQHRRNMMLRKSYTEAKVDADGRFRSSYNFAVKTGRLNSSKNPEGTGDNGQNTDREARGMYLADDGCVHVELDLSQEEDRIVKALTKCERLIALARRPPWEGDAHRETAAIIFGVSEVDVVHDQRQVGKMARHATNYDMEELEFSNHLLKRGIVASPEQCRQWIDRLREAEPEVPEWHRDVRRKLLYDRALTFACGFRVDYTHERLSKKLYKEAYAIEPQHGCVCHMNRYGLRMLDRTIKKSRWQSRINAHLHDALHLSVPIAELEVVLTTAYACLEREVDYHGVTIPKYVETKIGPSWGETWVEYKRLPATKALRKDIDETAGRMWEERRWE